MEIVGYRRAPARPWSPGWRCSARSWTAAQAGDNVGLLLRGIERKEIERGQVVAKPGSITPHTKFKAQVYVLTKEEGGRHTPFFNGYRPQFYFRTTDVTGSITLPEGVEMVMPGDNIEMDVELLVPRSPWMRACASPSARAAARWEPAGLSRSSSNTGISPPSVLTSSQDAR